MGKYFTGVRLYCMTFQIPVPVRFAPPAGYHCLFSTPGEYGNMPYELEYFEALHNCHNQGRMALYA